VNNYPVPVESDSNGVLYFTAAVNRMHFNLSVTGVFIRQYRYPAPDALTGHYQNEVQQFEMHPLKFESF
jgi:hypothetical protein